MKCNQYLFYFNRTYTKENVHCQYTLVKFDIYDDEKIWGKFQRDCTPTTRKTEEINKFRVLHMAFNKGGIPFPMQSSISPQIKQMYT